MKVLVYPHLMEIGGSQLNAIELAAAVQRRGHDVVLLAPEGELRPVAQRLGLEVFSSPTPGRWPTPAAMTALGQLVNRRGIEVLHGYEWGPAVEMALGPHKAGTPMVITSMSMGIPHFLPRHVPLVAGTAALVREHQELRAGGGHADVHLMEPPVDTDHYAPRENPSARVRFGLAVDDVVIAVICRLTTDLDKLAGVLDAVDVVGRLSATWPVRLLVVGGGPGLDEVRVAAEKVNAGTGRETVVVTGGVDDPTDAYDAADIVIGMGSSALKGLASGKPLVVQGEAGFWQLLTSQNQDTFLHAGWFGAGGLGAPDLEAALRELLPDSALRERLGELGRALVQHRYSLDAAADQLIALYDDVRAHQRVDRRELVRTAAELAKFKAVRFAQERGWRER